MGSAKVWSGVGGGGVFSGQDPQRRRRGLVKVIESTTHTAHPLGFQNVANRHKVLTLHQQPRIGSQVDLT